MALAKVEAPTFGQGAKTPDAHSSPQTAPIQPTHPRFGYGTVEIHPITPIAEVYIDDPMSYSRETFLSLDSGLEQRTVLKRLLEDPSNLVKKAKFEELYPEGEIEYETSFIESKFFDVALRMMSEGYQPTQEDRDIVSEYVQGANFEQVRNQMEIEGYRLREDILMEIPAGQIGNFNKGRLMVYGIREEIRREKEAEKAKEEKLSFAQRLNLMYFRGQARQMGLREPPDPSRINGAVIYAAREPLPVGEYNGNMDLRRKERKAYGASLSDALASAEKHTLTGVPLN